MWMAGQAAEGLRLAQRVIDLAEGDPTKGSLGPIGSPLAAAILMRGSCRYCLGVPGWREDLDQAIAMARSVGDACGYLVAVVYKYRSPSMPGRCSPTRRLTGTPPKRWRWPSIPAMTSRWMAPG